MIKAILFAAAALLAPAAASARWHEASSAHFVVYSNEDPEKLRAFAIRLERFDKAMRVRHGLDDPPVGNANRVAVYVVPHVAAVQRLVGPGGRNVAGFYVGRASGSVAFVPRRVGSGSINDTNSHIIFFHEYAHHFMLANFGGAYPAWFVEGFAEFYSTARDEKDGGVGIGAPANHRGYSLANPSALSIERLLSGDYTKLDERERDALYSRGWLLMHYLSFEPARAGQLARYLEAIQNGSASIDAAKSAFGDLKILSRELDRYVRRPMLTYVPIAPARLPIGSVAVRPLTAGEAAFIDIRMRSTRGVDARTTAALVAEARRAAGPFAGDATVQAMLAEVEFDAGNLAEAEAAADRALAANPSNGDALIYKGRIEVAQAVAAKATDPKVWRDARHWFVKASKIDTEDAEPKVLYFASFAAAGAPPTKNAIEALIYAHQLAPQDGGVRLQVARQLILDERLKEARSVFAPVTFNPHASGPQRQWATRVMTRLAANDGKGAILMWDTRPDEPASDGD